MGKLRVASFGIRGLVGDSLTPRVVIDFASAFATFAEGGRLLLGRDTRYSSPMLHYAVSSGLMSAGCEVLDFGICPTPVLQYSVDKYKAAGAVSISGGHNAMGWNAVTLIGPDGAFLDPSGGVTVLDIFHAADFLKAEWNRIGEMHLVNDFVDPYFDALERVVNVKTIREADFTVLIDPVGGAGCTYIEPFADLMGFSLVPVNAGPSGYLAREPEPRPRSALQMASIIRYTGGDVGFVLSSDMGRMSLVTEEGEPASEEYTLAVIADHLLNKQSGPFVTNICTTRTVDDIAAKHDVPVIRTKVGQAYIMAALADEQGVVGGEGSGSVAYPAFSPAFDGFLMMALTLEAMAERKKPLSGLLNLLPRYQIVKRSVPCGSREGYRAIEALKQYKEIWKGGHIDLTDGLRVDWSDGWVHARTSQTQQMVRVTSEAKTRMAAEYRADEVARLVQLSV